MTQKRREEEDRRKIPRYSDNELVLTMLQTKRWIKALITVCIAIGVFELIFSLAQGLEQGAKGIFFVIVFFIFAHLFKGVLYTMNLYIENHSQTNLRRYHEAQNNVYTYLALMFITTFLLSLLTRF